MLQLEHLNILVKDIETTLVFYQAALPHWSIRGRGKTSYTGVERDWVHFGDNYHYLTFNNAGHGQVRPPKSLDVGISHFAFVCQDINAVITRLEQAGFTPYIPLSQDNARYSVYFLDPTGFEVEFVQYISDLPAERNNYQAT